VAAEHLTCAKTVTHSKIESLLRAAVAAKGAAILAATEARAAAASVARERAAIRMGALSGLERAVRAANPIMAAGAERAEEVVIIGTTTAREGTVLRVRSVMVDKAALLTADQQVAAEAVATLAAAAAAAAVGIVACPALFDQRAVVEAAARLTLSRVRPAQRCGADGNTRPVMASSSLVGNDERSR
jgi:hypothetical protein